jgi:hypothetical protein
MISHRDSRFLEGRFVKGAHPDLRQYGPFKPAPIRPTATYLTGFPQIRKADALQF